MSRPTLPDGLEHVRTTDVFDDTTVPAGLLGAHRVADGVWGNLVVHTGAVTFVFDDEPDHLITARAGDTVAIPPARQHHLELDEPATFAVEFHRMPSAPVPETGSESTALVPGSPGQRHERGARAGMDRTGRPPLVRPLEHPDT